MIHGGDMKFFFKRRLNLVDIVIIMVATAAVKDIGWWALLVYFVGSVVSVAGEHYTGMDKE